MDSPQCKICGARTVVAFSLPGTKYSGHPIPDIENDCPYFECQNCHFLFSTILDNVSNEEVYSENYWDSIDPDWNGRVSETMRLVMFGGKYLPRDYWQMKILDFGCGMGCFVDVARKLGLKAWGTDINKPKFAREFFVEKIGTPIYDIVVACEVIEHLNDPVSVVSQILSSLTIGGIFAFQTAYYDPKVCTRDWWYVGPANGHISLYSVGAFQSLAKKLGVTVLNIWNGYPGIQIWQKTR